MIGGTCIILRVATVAFGIWLGVTQVELLFLIVGRDGLMERDFMWGFYWSNGMIAEQDVFTDTMLNSKQIVMWGTDPLAICQMYGGFLSSITWPWYRRTRKEDRGNQSRPSICNR